MSAGTAIGKLVTSPITITWRLANIIERRLGILATLAIGAATLLLGYVFTSTVIGFVIGIPLMFFGSIVFVRGVV